MFEAQEQDAALMGNLRTFDDRVGDRMPSHWKRLA